MDGARPVAACAGHRRERVVTFRRHAEIASRLRLHMVTSAWAVALLMCASAGDDPPCTPTVRVRAATALVRSLLDDVTAASATVRGLMSRLDQTDAIVYIEQTMSPGIPLARTKLVNANRDARFLRIGINAALPWPDVMPLIAHELQHAVEIAERRDVRDDAAVRRLYARIGRKVGQDSFETDAARDVELRVRAEIRK